MQSFMLRKSERTERLGQRGGGNDGSSAFRRIRVQKFPGLLLQGSGQPLDVEDADVAFSSLDRADVGAVEAGSVGQGFLREGGARACAGPVAGKGAKRGS